MDNKSSITALMSAFGRAYHAENEKHPVFCDTLARSLMTDEKYAAVQDYILSGARFFEPECDPSAEPDKLLRQIVNTHIAPSPLCRAAYTERSLKTAVLTGTDHSGLQKGNYRKIKGLSALFTRIKRKYITDKSYKKATIQNA